MTANGRSIGTSVRLLPLQSGRCRRQVERLQQVEQPRTNHLPHPQAYAAHLARLRLVAVDGLRHFTRHQGVQSLDTAHTSNSCQIGLQPLWIKRLQLSKQKHFLP